VPVGGPEYYCHWQNNWETDSSLTEWTGDPDAEDTGGTPEW